MTRLQLWRHEHRLSRMQAARELGIARMTLETIEKGHMPSLRVEQRLCAYFQSPWYYIASAVSSHLHKASEDRIRTSR